MPKKVTRKKIIRKRRNPVDINSIDRHFNKASEHLLSIYHDLSENEQEELEKLSRDLNRFKIKLYNKYWRHA